MKLSVILLTAGFLVIQTIAQDAEEIREKRGLMGPPGAGLYGAGTDPDSPDNSLYGPPVSYAGGPMAPYLALKPFLPTKPKPFASPFVDPNYFIAQKAKMLGGMFPPQAMIEDPSAIEKRQAPLDPTQKELLDSFGGIPPQQMIMSPDFWMYPTPAPKPTIVPPGYWSPFGPGSAPPVGGPGIVDPSIFISKKTKFLNDLFAAKASSTPAPPLDPADIYTAKVDEFLSKLREALNVTTPPKLDKREVTATTDPTDGVDPKDKVLSSILDELSNIKNSMLATASEIIKQQQTAAASPASKIPKKPLPPPGSIGAYWAAKGSAAAAAADPLAPYQKRLETLGQVFDMLTQLEKDLTSALQVPPTTTVAPTTPAQPQVNITALVEALNKAQQTQFGAGPLVLGPAYPNPGYAYIPSMRRRRSSNSGYYARDYPGQVLSQQNYPGQGFQQQRQKQQENFQERGGQGQNSDDFNSKILEFIVDQLGQSRRHHHH